MRRAINRSCLLGDGLSLAKVSHQSRGTSKTTRCSSSLTTTLRTVATKTTRISERARTCPKSQTANTLLITRRFEFAESVKSSTQQASTSSSETDTKAKEETATTAAAATEVNSTEETASCATDSAKEATSSTASEKDETASQKTSNTTSVNDFDEDVIVQPTPENLRADHDDGLSDNSTFKNASASTDHTDLETGANKTTTSSTTATSADVQRPVGEQVEMDFKTETRQLLDIVACSLYSDKEVFIRELVSNASDALEKRHLLQLSNPEYARTSDDEAPLIAISCNQNKSRFVIRDTGVGMTREQLAENLGTIAGSGSKAFVRELQSSGQSAAEKIIGQFGVGFYACFMVAKRVRVFSRSAKQGAKGYMWESDGTGKFTITECEGVQKGTKIVLQVKDTELAFCTPQVVERVLKKYSNFVSYEITLNGGKVNTVEAL